jgi:hypothetical protein
MKNFIIIAFIILALFLSISYANAQNINLSVEVASTFENSGEIQVTTTGNLTSITLRP